jgi:hypothetical protein
VTFVDTAPRGTVTRRPFGRESVPPFGPITALAETLDTGTVHRSVPTRAFTSEGTPLGESVVDVLVQVLVLVEVLVDVLVLVTEVSDAFAPGGERRSRIPSGDVGASAQATVSPPSARARAGAAVRSTVRKERVWRGSGAPGVVLRGADMVV